MADTIRNLKKTAEWILPLLSPGTTLCVFDTETDGLPRSGKPVHIIQFSAIRYRVKEAYQFEEIDFFDRYINPGIALPQKIVMLTGITDEMLHPAPTEEIVGPQIFKYIENADVWAAYNAAFDLGRLSDMSDRLGFFFEERPCIDVLEMSRDWLRKGEDVVDNRLGSTYGFLYPDGAITFHNSMEDVRATVAVLEALLPKYISLGKDQGPIKNIHVSKVRAWVNCARTSQQRIRITMDAPFPVKDGDIFYDCVLKCWSHASSTAAKKAFSSFSLTDFEEIERQALELASSVYCRYYSMDELARDRIPFILKKIKEGKKNRA